MALQRYDKLPEIRRKRLSVYGRTKSNQLPARVVGGYTDRILKVNLSTQEISIRELPPDRLLEANDTICFIPGIGGG